ncbi:EAL domain-containing protein [Bacillus sp. T33-2]|uniref:EAL domain-containing protein n=1 Tax=Bacillus sp. T33-2 TaxID=2054168 RepID=UPI000C786A32|nr:EAL domain-containing protein [Bacillus sp. T33-2]PLR97698.1 diguanylate phosphodiesterase [Bacillus sp. T33-2]
MGTPVLKIPELIRERLFYTEFQPLWDPATDTIFAFEAFIRTVPLINPLVIFENARKTGDLYDFDTASLVNAVKEYPNSYFQKYLLFVNVFPSTIIHSQFPEFIQKLVESYPDITGRVVFEINEAAIEQCYWAKAIFSERLSLLKTNGFQIAFDDMTFSKMTLKKITKFGPDFVKLDRSCSEKLTDSPDKQNNIARLLSFSNEDMKVVLEGIETNADLLTAKELGVPLLQGYYIARPGRL